MGEPLTKEERSQITAAIARTQNQWDGGHHELKLAMRGESYWREVVKNSEIPIVWTNTSGELECSFCKIMFSCDEDQHADGCPWLLAQDPI